MIANEKAVNPTVTEEVNEVSEWLKAQEMEPQRVEISGDGVKIVFPRECYEDFVAEFKGQAAKLHRGTYGTNWIVITRDRWRFECYTPKLPDQEDMTL